MQIRLTKTSRSRKPQDFTHLVNTTADWGSLQPIMCHECIGGSKAVIDVKSRMQLMPLVSATFGMARLKHYAYFVPTMDLYMPYENLQSGTAYNGETNYIPYTVPFSTLRGLSSLLLLKGMCRVIGFSYRIGNWGARPASGNIEITGRQAPTEDWQSEWETAAQNHGYIWISSSEFSLQEVESPRLTADVDFNDADFHIKLRESLVGNVETGKFFAIKLTKKGKRLRKILLGLGYQVNFNSSLHLSILPIFAYYKAYYDIFAIKRTSNWQYTKCAKLLSRIAYRNITNFNDNRNSLMPDFYDFVVNELVDCFYTESPNYYTCQQDNLYNLQTEVELSTVDQAENDPDEGILQDYSSVKFTPETGGITSNISARSPLAQRLAQRVLKIVNRNSVIGGRIAAYFAANGLGDTDDNKETNFVGASNIDCEFDTIYSTADTSEGGLGDFTGKGYSIGGSDKWTYECKRHGFLIVMSCVVPHADFVQGVDACLLHRTRYDFYQPELDAMMWTATPKEVFIGMNEVGVENGEYENQATFGIVPAYSEYKTKFGICNGDISLRSTRTELLPYVLDRWFTPISIEPYGDAEQERTQYVMKGVSIPIVNDALRYIGRDESFGNFNRIFANYHDEEVGEKDVNLEDNFILNNRINFTLISGMLPMKDSFDTEGLNGGTMAIEKA